MNQNQQKSVIAPWLLIVLIVVLLAGIGFFVWYYFISGKSTTIPNVTSSTVKSPKTSSSPTADMTANWKTFILETSKGTFKYPDDWQITFDSTGTGTDSDYYYINKDAKGGSGSISEFNLTEWIKGPSPDAGYVLSKEKRVVALDLMKEIYQNQKITPETAKKFEGLGVEFFPYMTEDMAGLQYIASNDNKSRGFSVIGTRGQDIGLATMYTVSLYNLDKNIIVSFRYPLDTANTPQAKLLQDKLDVAIKVSNEEAEKVNTEIHQEFIELMSSISREDLGFGSTMNQVDLSAKSLKF